MTVSPTGDRAGHLVLVVGPSGAGKDSLIAAARTRLAGDDRFVFPTRTVTRPPSPAEENRHLSVDAFAEARANGAFALDWRAHGHAYGVPAAIVADLGVGRTVVVNVSRTIVAEARTRFARVTAIEVTAPAEVLARRIAGRARPSDGASGDRLDRRLPEEARRPADVTIDNGGRLDEAITAFLAAIGGIPSERTPS
jgi:ribose 1,5-bisphosphokinase